jgi:hypothetical protein
MTLLQTDPKVDAMPDTHSPSHTATLAIVPARAFDRTRSLARAACHAAPWLAHAASTRLVCGSRQLQSLQHVGC